jgi:7-cyano-7-deazaguanine synthase
MTKKLYPLLSGGIDSTIGTLKRIQVRDFSEIQPIFIDYGQKARELEWNSVLAVSQKLAGLADDGNTMFRSPKRIVFSCITDQNRIFQWSRSRLIIGNSGEDPYVENRNMILVSTAASYVESQIGESEYGAIITGFRDEYSDTKREFVASLNCLLKILLAERKKTVQVEAPIIDYGPRGKGKLLADFQEYKNIIDLTWSCYEPENGKPCMKCQACRQERRVYRSLWPMRSKLFLSVRLGSKYTRT